MNEFTFQNKFLQYYGWGEINKLFFNYFSLTIGIKPDKL